MRAELVFAALTCKSNRYELCRLAAKATRILHRPNTRVQETMNDALQHLALERPKPVMEIVEPLHIAQEHAA
jgi:hypothetical protein